MGEQWIRELLTDTHWNIAPAVPEQYADGSVVWYEGCKQPATIIGKTADGQYLLEPGRRSNKAKRRKIVSKAPEDLAFSPSPTQVLSSSMKSVSEAGSLSEAGSAVVFKHHGEWIKGTIEAQRKLRKRWTKVRYDDGKKVAYRRDSEHVYPAECHQALKTIQNASVTAKFRKWEEARRSEADQKPETR